MTVSRWKAIKHSNHGSVQSTCHWMIISVNNAQVKCLLHTPYRISRKMEELMTYDPEVVQLRLISIT